MSREGFLNPSSSDRRSENCHLESSLTEDDVDWSIQSNRSSSTKLQSQNRHKLEIGKCASFTSLIQGVFIFCSLFIVSYLLVANQSVAEKTNKIVVVRALREGQGLRIRC